MKKKKECHELQLGRKIAGLEPYFVSVHIRKGPLHLSMFT